MQRGFRHSGHSELAKRDAEAEASNLPMKSIFRLLSVALALVLAGCIEHDVVISVNKDGSGTVTERTTVASAMLDQMAALGGEAGGMADQFVDREAAEKRAAEMGEGVSVESAEAIEANGRKGGRVVFAFADINKLTYNFGGGMDDMGGAMGDGEDEEDAEEQEPMKFEFADGVLTMKNPQDADAAEGVEAPESEEMDDQSLAMAKQMMGDMRLSMKLSFPGGIKETNASHVDGDTVTLMEMEMGKLLEDPEKFRKLSAAQPETPAEIQAAVKGIEGVKVESAEEIRVELK